MATHYEVYLVVEDALEEAEIFADLVDAEDWALDEIESCRAADATADAYIVPHYCDMTQDCECAQWMTDHQPFASTR